MNLPFLTPLSEKKDACGYTHLLEYSIWKKTSHNKKKNENLLVSEWSTTRQKQIDIT